MGNMFSLDGRVALVTGASRGLGKTMAGALAEAGAHVVLAARTESDLQANAKAIRAAGGKASVLTMDVTDEAAVVDGVARVARDLGQLDILVNNAGVVQRTLMLDTATEDWDRVVETNLTALFRMAREAARPMVANGWGRIINIGSIMSVVSRPTVGSYAATKHAVVGLTKTLAAELGSRGVTANAIGPGYFRTELNVVLQQDPEFNAMLEARCPAGRWGEQSELGGVVVFLASDAASFVNGHLLIVDGGMTVNL